MGAGLADGAEVRAPLRLHDAFEGITAPGAALSRPVVDRQMQLLLA